MVAVDFSSKKSTRPQERWRCGADKFWRTFDKKIEVKQRKRSNFSSELERKKIRKEEERK